MNRKTNKWTKLNNKTFSITAFHSKFECILQKLNYPNKSKLNKIDKHNTESDKKYEMANVQMYCIENYQWKSYAFKKTHFQWMLISVVVFLWYFLLQSFAFNSCCNWWDFFCCWQNKLFNERLVSLFLSLRFVHFNLFFFVESFQTDFRLKQKGKPNQRNENTRKHILREKTKTQTININSMLTSKWIDFSVWV